MSVRGNTGSRRLAKQGQTAGHAGEEAESWGRGRGSHQLGTPSPLLLHHQTPQLGWLCRERRGGGQPGAGEEEASQGTGCC